MKTKIHKRIGMIFLSLTLCLHLLPATALGMEPANGAAEASWQTSADGQWQSGQFVDAIAGVYDGGTVQLLTDVVVSETITIQKSMTVTSETPDTPKQITRGSNAKAYLLSIEGDTTVSVIMKDVIVDGNSKNGAAAKRALIAVNGGELVLEKGAVIRNNNNDADRENANEYGDGGGGGICVVSGKTQINAGAKIENCSAYSGGGVAVIYKDASLVINGGTISDCKATDTTVEGGGAVYVEGDAVVSMESGKLSDNRAALHGGAVHILSGTFTQNGGTIAGNYAQNNGGAVYLSAGTFTQSGGTIAQNKAAEGGAVSVRAGTFKKSGGTIAGNHASNGGGVFVRNTDGAQFIMSGGSIRDNTAHRGAGIFVNNGTLEVSGGEIIGNAASDKDTSHGGAIYVTPFGKVFLSGSPVIAGNTSNHHGRDDILLDWDSTISPAPVKLDDRLQEGAEIGIMICDGIRDGVVAGKVAIVGDGYTVTPDDLSKIEYTSYRYHLSLNERGEAVVQEAIPVTGISVAPKSLSLTAGDSRVITARVTPDDATYPEISWSSSDQAIATVDANGRVTAVNPGTAIITAAASSDDPVTDVCIVTVTRPSSGDSGSSSAALYPITVEDSAHGQVESNRTRAEEGDTVTLTVTPDEGWELNELTVTDSRGNEITVRDRGNGKYTFPMPRSRATVEAIFTEITPEPLPFTDVPAGAWCESAIRYVYENGLMTGTSATTFGPNDVTSRAQIVTILWRIAGSPVVNSLMDFSDVPADAYYTEAVRWAASEGIAGGYGNRKFGPNDPITREQFAAILYRYEQEQGGGFTGAWAFPLQYEDAEQVSDWAYEPLCWMTMKGIISGTSGTTLSPKGQATRAQAAVMLMRFCQNNK